MDGRQEHAWQCRVAMVGGGRHVIDRLPAPRTNSFVCNNNNNNYSNTREWWAQAQSRAHPVNTRPQMQQHRLSRESAMRRVIGALSPPSASWCSSGSKSTCIAHGPSSAPCATSSSPVDDRTKEHSHLATHRVPPTAATHGSHAHWPLPQSANAHPPMPRRSAQRPARPERAYSRADGPGWESCPAG